MATTTQVKVPDIGDFSNIPVIEIHVTPGDVIAEEDTLITLESDKATMDVPSSASGKVEQVHVEVGDEVSAGSVILSLVPSAVGPAASDRTGADPAGLVGQMESTVETAPDPTAASQAPAARSAAEVSEASAPESPSPAAGPHAGPSVRRLARELGVDLSSIRGSGEKGRITKEDLRESLRNPTATTPATAAASGAGIPEIPAQDFAKFGPIETRSLSRIKRVSGPHLHRSWLNVPHVTHNDEADITDLDAYRKELDTAAKNEGYRVTLLAFLMKASVSALRRFPEVNSSLSPEKDSLVLKQYYNVGVAVDTPDGLVVPVVRDVDRKGVSDISRELGAISVKAREGKLAAQDMQGGTFTISSLGGIGGTSFTPIVNAPEVAILGVVRSRTAPVWNGKKFKPRLLLPVSLSYDHRVIDGALAARFVRHLCEAVEDVRRLVL